MKIVYLEQCARMSRGADFRVVTDYVVKKLVNDASLAIGDHLSVEFVQDLCEREDWTVKIT